MNQTERIHVLYSGNVQGVGFRFITERIARGMALTGFVRNLSNGNVEIVCEGSKTRLEEFLGSINENMRGYIGDSRVKWEPSRGEFSTFEIRF
jgi:acylphosphatase